MATLSELLEFRDALAKARYAGVREVTDSNGESVRYATDREMAAALAAIDREIEAQTGKPPSAIIFHTSKGNV